MNRETRRSLVGLGVLCALGAGAYAARNALGLEWSAESVRETVASYGLWGPLVFVLLTGFRSLLLIPSQILLVAGGLCFGAAAGTIYGGLGMVISGSAAFGLARYVGREAILTNVPESMRWAFSAAGSKAGAAVVFVGTGYPVGPVTAFHAGAGLTAMAIPVFLAALLGGSLLRAWIYASFGSVLVGGDWRILAAGALLLAAAALPLAHPRSRRWLKTRLDVSRSGGR
jgi:uncharacterized membrane protein YdjX (TVP38/TMEM64 family)